jgi:ribosomal protein L7/L12
MPFSHIRFPPEAIAALEQGNVIVAIKSVRSANDMDLRTAKQTVEAYLRGERSFSTGPAAATAQVVPETGELPSAALAALAKGERIEAIKIVRDHHGLHLKEAMEKVDAYLGRHPSRHRQKLRTSTVERDWLLPRGWWILFALALLAAFYFLR